MRTVTLLVAVLAALAACGARADRPGDPAPPPSGAPEIHDAWTSCRQEADPSTFEPTIVLSLPRLPAGFEPAELVVCSAGTQQRPDGGEDFVQLERRGRDVAAVTAALRLPSAPLTGNPCTADLPGIPWFAVLDAAGHWLRPGVAADACGKIRFEARTAVEHAQLTVVATTVLGESRSASSAASGCPMGYGNMVAAETAGGRLPGAEPDAPTGEMRVCLYTVAPAERGGDKPAGRFDRGGQISAAAWAPLRTTLLAAGPPAPCTANAGRFALIRRADNNLGAVYFELDGCHRLLFETASGSAVRQGTPALAAELERAV
ncbi:hypothetical protein [Dactylosporangium matsuzakiense]|uniref:Uncharacterized protein n=1 Tax=Dactylosporangium matsuzakiense TaxID=53360 RepID=A0A9W6KKE1_9ACTN|nr:hypothetical protein [Dactylosporangium matsuzakiense]UWZ48112.1 hypothetical protein Dmats_17930 [Dactylosporangium matsuzakiense]GLL03128.1 hypothetical protein GCM10017581_048710 [Dactylosporangium matsuzakiense]